MIVSIHQPNFLPWLGYFYKMARADKFIFLDNVPLADRTYTNRVQIKTASGPKWLTVPVLSKGKSGQLIADAEVVCSHHADWRRKIPRVLDINYHKCPFYSRYADRINQIIGSAAVNLANMNIRLIEYLAGQLRICVPTVRATTMQARGKATEMLIALCKELGADTYVSGAGGAKYQDEEAYARAGIRLVYSNFKHPTYPQAFGEFVTGLSVLDLLFNCGPASRDILLELEAC